MLESKATVPYGQRKKGKTRRNTPSRARRLTIKNLEKHRDKFTPETASKAGSWQRTEEQKERLRQMAKAAGIARQKKHPNNPGYVSKDIQAEYGRKGKAISMQNTELRKRLSEEGVISTLEGKSNNTDFHTYLSIVISKWLSDNANEQVVSDYMISQLSSLDKWSERFIASQSYIQPGKFILKSIRMVLKVYAVNGHLAPFYDNHYKKVVTDFYYICSIPKCAIVIKKEDLNIRNPKNNDFKFIYYPQTKELKEYKQQ